MSLMKYEPNAPTAMIWRVLLASIGGLSILMNLSKLAGPSPWVGAFSLIAPLYLIVLAVRGRQHA